jgi:hypothetical protein
MRPASLALVLLITVAGRSAALSGPPPPSCPIQKTEPWASSSGCCCCQGECIYKNCPPCPCPAPLPGKPQPKCSLGSIRAAFASNYRAVIGKVKESEWPSKTQASGGHWSWATSAGWTSGFFPGLLWQLANATADAAFATAAAQWTAGREVEKTETSGHDIGFMIFGSFGNGVQLGSSNVSGYTSVVVEAAHSLAKRYNPTVGMTRSWGDIDDEKSFEVIIDNLMNLELLFWASAASGNSTLGAIAKSHATKTGQLWIREDGSTAHLCVFDPKTGKLQKPCTGTPQGLAADSTWARGQGWGIYGFTLAFRYTHDKSYLDFAEKVASFYLAAALPSLIPKWDFNATDTSPGGGAALVGASYVPACLSDWPCCMTHACVHRTPLRLQLRRLRCWSCRYSRASSSTTMPPST